MRKVYTIMLSLAVSSSLYAHGNNVKNQMSKEEMQQNHMGDHMHNGKLTNHSNPNGMSNQEMKKTSAKVNNHMGDHMHNGKLSNHSNPNGMSTQAMSQMNGMKNGSN